MGHCVGAQRHVSHRRSRSMKLQNESLSFLYLRDIRGVTSLPPDKDPRAALIHSCLPWGITVARRYVKRGLPLEELLSLASLAIVRAAQSYDKRKGTFTTYVTRMIIWTIHRAFILHGRPRPQPSDNTAIEEAAATHDTYEDGTSIQDVYAAIQTLSPREQFVVMHNYGLAGQAQRTHRWIGKRLGMSPSMSSSICRRAIAKLRVALRSKER